MSLILSDRKYWRLYDNEVDPDYPRDVKVWKGVPKTIDTAFIANGDEGNDRRLQDL